MNEALYKWFCIACSKNIFPGGPEHTEKAKEIAIKTNFMGSRGWLDKWKKRFTVKEMKICGEPGDVEGATVELWKERLPEIVQGYEKDDISGTWIRQDCFGEHCQIKVLVKNPSSAKEEKQ